MHQRPQHYGIQSTSVDDHLTMTHEDNGRRSSSSSSDRRRHELTDMDIDSLARTIAQHTNTAQMMNTFNTMAPWPPFSPTLQLPASASAAAAAAAVMPLSFEEISLASSPGVMDSTTYYNPSSVGVHGLIQEPHVNDVLCGRGGSINSHPGNRKFRDWVIQRKESYLLAKSKSDKSQVTTDILHLVRAQTPPGRFLQKFTVNQSIGGRSRSKSSSHSSSSSSGLGGWWVEIDEMKALAKCSQALREGAPAFRALHKAEKKGRYKQSSISEAGGSRLSSTRNKPLELPKLAPPPPLVPSMNIIQPPSRAGGATPASSTQELKAASRLPPALPPPTFPSEIDEAERELNVLFPVSSRIFETESNDNNRSISSFPLLHLGDYSASMSDVAKAIPTPTTTESKPVITTTTPTTIDKWPPGEWFPGSLLYSPFTPFVSPGLTPHAEGKRPAGSAGWLDAISFLPNLSPMPPVHGKSTEEEGHNLKRSHSLSSFSEGDFYSDDSFKNPFENDNGNPDRKQEPLCKSASMTQGQSSDPNHGTMFAEAQSRTFLPPPHGHTMERLGLYGGSTSFHRNNSSSWHKTSRASSISSLSQRSISNLNNHSKRKSIS